MTLLESQLQAPIVARPQPRARVGWDTLALTEKSGASLEEAAHLAKTYTVFLGSRGNFDYWGDIDTGNSISVGCNGCRSTGFGNRFHFQIFKLETDLTVAGEDW